MERAGEYRCWAELLPDALGLIFSNLSLQEILMVIPRVCKSWNQAVLGPYCWQNINIEEWSYRSNPDNIDRMLRMLIARSGGALREITVSGLQNHLIFSFIAEHACSLQKLQLQRSNMSDSITEQVAGRLSTVTFFDLSYCCKIGARGLEAIGKNCKLLAGLRRNMHPIDLEGKLSQNDEAHAIATTMPKLKHLEMAYLCIDTAGVLEIMWSCAELQLLDVRGCWDVKLDEKWVKEKAPKVKVLGPHVVDDYERNIDWEECSDYSDEDSFYDDESLDSLELRFYEEFDENYTNGWPPSPSEWHL